MALTLAEVRTLAVDLQRLVLQPSGTVILALSKRVTFLIRRNEFFYAWRHNSTGIRDIVRQIVLRK